MTEENKAADGQLVERITEKLLFWKQALLSEEGSYYEAQEVAEFLVDCCLSSRDKEWSGWGIVEVAVRNPSVAEYMKHWEDRVKVAEDKLKSITENADFLRKSVGACHMMISRNDLEELRQDEWDATHLPPRLYKFIGELKGNLVALQDVEKAIIQLYCFAHGNGISAAEFAKNVLKRLKPEPAKQEPTPQDKVEAI